MLVVTGESGDYLLARELDTGTEGTRIFTVAKPYLLRMAPFDGETRNGITYAYTDVNTRTATNEDDESITEVITPSYQADDIIYAMTGITGGTGVYDEDDIEVEWVEVSGASGARMWAETDE